MFFIISFALTVRNKCISYSQKIKDFLALGIWKKFFNALHIGNVENIIHTLRQMQKQIAYDGLLIPSK